MSSSADFIVFSPDYRLQLVVEVKGMPHADQEWAATFRRNLLAHGVVPSAPYFLLVLPEHFYLWRDAPEHGVVKPDFQADTHRVLRDYLPFEGRDEESRQVDEPWLEVAVEVWLSELTDPRPWTAVWRPENEWLRTSGLADRVRSGFVKAESIP